MQARRVVFAMLALAACGQRPEEVVPAPSASASAPAGPTVSVAADRGVFLDGERVADAPTAERTVPVLAEALKARRLAWRAEQQNLSKPFPGAVVVELAPDASCQSALAVLRACIDGGFPNVSLDIGGPRQRLGLTDLDWSGRTESTPRLSFRADGWVELSKLACFPPYAIVKPAEMVPYLKRLLPQSTLSVARVACEPGVAFRSVAAVFSEDTAPTQLAFADPCKEEPVASIVADPAVKATVSVEVIEDKEALGKKRIDSAVDALRPKLLACYGLRPSKPKPGWANALLLNLQIGDTGVVTSGSTTDALQPFPFENVMKCVDREARALRLDPPPSVLSDIQLRLEFQER